MEDGSQLPALRDFAAAIWREKGVERACLELQDRHGADVCLALLGLYLAYRGRAVAPGAAARARDAALDWSGAVTAPLRAARRALKSLDAGDRAVADLAARAAALELESEFMLLDRLEAIAAGAPEAAGGYEALAASNLRALIGTAADADAGRALVRAGSARAGRSVWSA